MGMFCPLINDMCKKNECILWKDECLLYTFLSTRENLLISATSKKRKDPKTPDPFLSATAEEIADEIFQFFIENDTPSDEYRRDQLFEEFWEEKGVDIWEYPKETQSNIKKAKIIVKNKLSEIEEKKINELLISIDFEKEIYNSAKHENPMHYQWKIDSIAKSILEDNGIKYYELSNQNQSKINQICSNVQNLLENDLRERMKKEQEIMDQLVTQAVSWAKSHGLNRFTKADTKAYLMEREIDILRNTEDLFYTKVNQELRRKPY